MWHFFVISFLFFFYYFRSFSSSLSSVSSIFMYSCPISSSPSVKSPCFLFMCITSLVMFQRKFYIRVYLKYSFSYDFFSLSLSLSLSLFFVFFSFVFVYNHFTVAVVVAFFFCWAPFHAQRLLASYAGNNQLFVYVITTYVSGILYYLSTCINPLLYNIMSNKFREAFKV